MMCVMPPVESGRLLFYKIIFLISTIMNTIKRILFSLVLLITCYSAKGQTHSATNFPVDSAMDAYFWIKDGLTRDNANIVYDHAKNLVTIAQASISTEKNKQTAASLSKVITEAGFIAGTHDINIQRKHFVNLSSAMYDLVKNTGVTGMAVVQRYCPMKKATWLSDDGDLRNPYFGSAMAACSKVLVTIPARKS